MKRSSVIISLLLLSLSPAFQKSAFGFEPTSQKKNFSYYFLSLYFDSKANTVALSEKEGSTGQAVDLTNYNLTKDSGSGSQFFAKVINSGDEAEKFSDGDDRFYLGKWEMRKFWDSIGKDKEPTGGSEIVDKGTVSVSIPYFPDGQKIEIYDAKTEELALSVDISKFSKPGAAQKNLASSGGLAPVSGQSGSASSQAGQLAAAGGSSLGVIAWLIVIVFVLALAGGGIFLYYRYRNYKKVLLAKQPESGEKQN